MNHTEHYGDVGNASGVEELYITKKQVVILTGFQYHDLDAFIQLNNVPYENNLIPVFKFIDALRKATKKVPKREDDMEKAKRHEEVMKLRIVNQERLRKLIPIQDAKVRVKKAFSAVAKYIQHGCKAAAPRVAICQDVRECERIMLAAYDTAIDQLAKEAKIISWEDDGAKTELRGTELPESAPEDSSGAGAGEDTDTSEG